MSARMNGRLRILTLVAVAVMSISARASADLISPDNPPPPQTPEDKAPKAKPSGGCAPTKDDDSFLRLVGPLGLALLVPIALRRRTSTSTSTYSA
jgi:hypothetical protein